MSDAAKALYLSIDFHASPDVIIRKLDTALQAERAKVWKEAAKVLERSMKIPTTHHLVMREDIIDWYRKQAEKCRAKAKEQLCNAVGRASI